MSFTDNKKRVTRAALVFGVSVACGLTTLLTPASSFAQGATAGSVRKASGVTSSTYRIAAEDVLDISVVDHPDVNRTVPVSTDGTIDLPYVGQVNVAGMTVGDLKKRVFRDLSKQFVRPQILITVTQRKVRTFNAIGGAVKSPGKHPLKEGQRLLEAISDAGGLPADRVEFFSAKLMRPENNQEIPIDLVKLFQNDPSQNILVQPDDFLYIAEKEPAETTVQVVGQVGKQGPVVWPRDGSIITVLQAAGGPTQMARLSQVVIERGGKNIPVDLRDYQKTGFEPTEKLLPGDKLVVPENKLEYYVFGPVAKSGAQMYPDDRKLTVSSALAFAGGNLQGVELKKTKLVRPIKDDKGNDVLDEKGEKKTIVKLVDVEKMWKTGDLSKDVPVEPGDYVIVPPAGGRRGLGLLEALGAAFSGIQILNFLR
jgi:polysaccharide export outer membrane protein